MTQDQNPQQDEQPQEQPDDQQPTRQAPAALEWLASAVALLLVMGTLGYLVWHAAQPARPVAFEVRAGKLERRLDRFYQQVEVRNLGSESAGQVELRGTLSQGGTVLEEVTGQIDGVPADSARSTTLIFRTDPEGRTLNLDIGSYGEP
jgi:uncharacterized protein (TIGR02588 family)